MCRVHVFQAWLGPMDWWDLGQADPLQWICREWVQELGFDETTVDVEGGDDRVGIKNTGMDGLMVRGNELLTRWYELPFGLIHQRPKGGTWASPPPPKEPPFFCGDLLPYMVLLLSILILHLLVILAHTWVHIPSATIYDVLWAVVTQIALSRGHVYINGARMLVVGI